MQPLANPVFNQIDPVEVLVIEGSLRPFLIWERVHYDWSESGWVRLTVEESNYCTSGSYVDATIKRIPTGSTEVHVVWNRTGIGLKGKILIATAVLTRGANLRRKVFQRAFDRADQAQVGR